jgi:hypothetical protein
MNLTVASILLTIASITGETGSSIPVAKAGQPISTYAQVYGQSAKDGKGIVVAAQVDGPTRRLLEDYARLRGLHFAVATRVDGFEPGAYELYVENGRLFFREELPMSAHAGLFTPIR